MFNVVSALSYWLYCLVKDPCIVFCTSTSMLKSVFSFASFFLPLQLGMTMRSFIRRFIWHPRILTHSRKVYVLDLSFGSPAGFAYPLAERASHVRNFVNLCCMVLYQSWGVHICSSVFRRDVQSYFILFKAKLTHSLHKRRSCCHGNWHPFNVAPTTISRCSIYHLRAIVYMLHMVLAPVLAPQNLQLNM